MKCARHFRFLVPGLGFALLLLGCGGGSSPPCNRPTCENSPYAPQLQVGTVTWTSNGVLLASVDVTTDSLEGGLALLSTTPGKIANPANPASPDPWRNGAPLTLQIAHQGVTLRTRDASVGEYGDAAAGGPGPGWSSGFRILSDPRTWTVGEVTVRQVSIDEQYLMDNRMVGLINGNPAGMHLLVTEAVGEATSFPAVVTPDFLRVFLLDYTGLLEDCTGTQAHLSLTFTLTAADFSVQRELCAMCK
jgi:hypothetical protein